MPCSCCHVHYPLQVGGSVQYNGKDFSQFVVERTAAYVDQVGAGLLQALQSAYLYVGTLCCVWCLHVSLLFKELPVHCRSYECLQRQALDRCSLLGGLLAAMCPLQLTFHILEVT
jgi:hypothetical protein